MYLVVIALTMFILPIVSAVVGHVYHPAEPILLLVGRWFVFWGVGVRLTLAGVRQLVQPAFTAQKIFHMSSDEAAPLVRELGFANVASGIVGLFSLVAPTFTLPIAISAAIFYGAAGVQHFAQPHRSRNETIAMASDLFIAIVLAIYVVAAVM